MKFEISQKQDKKTGYKHFKLSLSEIYNPDCVVNDIGTVFNDNGITWLEKYVERTKDTLIGSSVTVEFADESKTDILGHGETGEFKDGVPLLSNATSIGHFEKVYIDTIEDDFGNKKRVLIGEGYLDYMRYPSCINLLENKLSNGETVYGSVEILKTGNNENIVYLNEYRRYGRIPTEYEYSGYAILGCGVQPADHTATLIELSSLKNQNNLKEDIGTMDEKTLAIITDSVKATIIEMNNKAAELESTIASLNEQIAEKNAKIEELNGVVSEIEGCKKKMEECKAKSEEVETELNKVKEEKAKSELNSILSTFTDVEKEYAKEEISAFEKSPLTSEINSITAKIYEGIGKATISAKNDAKKIIAEQNAKKESVDIFSDVDDNTSSEDNGSIF